MMPRLESGVSVVTSGVWKRGRSYPTGREPKPALIALASETMVLSTYM